MGIGIRGIRGILASLMVIGLALSGRAAHSQEKPWPEEKPIRLIVGAPAGYSPDITTRLIAEVMRKELGQNIIVENKPGGGASEVMMRALMPAAPDGYTLAVVFWNQLSVAPSMTRKAIFDPVEDFTHIGIWQQGHQIIATHPNSGIQSIQDLVKKAKASEPPMQFASPGVGAPGRIFFELMLRNGEFKMQHVPLRGPDVFAGVARGDLPVGVNGVADALPMLAGGKLVPLAVTADNRLAILPDVPTLKEAGIPWDSHSIWAGIIGPKGMPPAIVERLSQALQRAAKSPELVDTVRARGNTIQAGTPAEMRDRIKAEVPYWRTVVTAAGITID